MSTIDRPATRWSVTALGASFLLTATVSPLAGQTDGRVVHVSLSTILALGVVAIGVHLAQSPIDTRTIQYAGAWTIGGALAMAAAGAWTLGMHPVTAATARSIIGFTLIAGGLAGSLVGAMYGHSRHRATMLADERERLSFLNYLLRHNVLNGVQVVTAQTDALRDAVPEHAEDRLDVVESWTRGLGDLVGRIRQFLDASTGDRALEPVDLDSVIATEVDKVETAFQADITTTGSDPAVRADDGLHQVFECLLVDVVERSEATHPTIDVTTSQRGDSVLVEIASPDPVASTDGGADLEPDTDGDPTGDLGFGRYLVVTLVDFYGGSVDIATSDDDTLYQIHLPIHAHS